MPLPPDDAYGRVTNPERFRVMHAAVLDLVSDLRRRFDVHVETVEADASDNSRGDTQTQVDRQLRVHPRTTGGRSITFSLTAFPGAYLHVGDDPLQGFPHCGCDACDEDPDDLVEELREAVEAATEHWPPLA